jgi:hypothetical protein
MEFFSYSNVETFLKTNNLGLSKLVVDESAINDSNLDQFTDVFQKFDYIKKWYKVENGLLVKQVAEIVVNYINLTTDVQDTVTPFDGIPDVPADGVTPATITVEVKNPDTNQVDTTANDILYVSTERGKLSTVNVQLVNGVGSFQITCTETVVTTIRVWHPQGKYKPGEIKIQFRPV